MTERAADGEHYVGHTDNYVQVLLPNPSSYLAAVTGTPLMLPGVQPPSAASLPTDNNAEEKKTKEGEAAGKPDEKKDSTIEEETPETEEV